MTSPETMSLDLTLEKTRIGTTLPMLVIDGQPYWSMLMCTLRLSSGKIPWGMMNGPSQALQIMNSPGRSSLFRITGTPGYRYTDFMFFSL